MRLLRTSPDSTLPETEEFLGDISSFPQYAILSHTWGDHEVTFKEFTSPSDSTSSKSGFRKILDACLEAKQRHNLQYTWVDTCCIDKASSAELTEAINSMYAWYKGAKVCYAYLSDLVPGTLEDLEEALPSCRWFSRGWTLQELIAPSEVIFFDRGWNKRGTKHSLSKLLSKITGIPVGLLEGQTPLESFSAAQRMSWASKRETTRIEDTAYCLLGIFDVNLSLIYGEGKKAFQRLQEAIVLSTADRSIFMWKDDPNKSPKRMLAPILAEEPSQFFECGDICSPLEDTVYRQFTANTRGFQVQASLTADPIAMARDDAYKCMFDLHCTRNGTRVAIAVRKVGTGRYARYKPHKTFELRDEIHAANILIEDTPDRKLVETLTLATRIEMNPPFPFPGRDAVIGNRSSALRATFSPNLSIDYRRMMPRTNWDWHDGIFFGSTTQNKSWCAFFIRGMVKITEDTSCPIHIFLSCGYWNIGLPKVIVASLHDMNPAVVALLEVRLENIPFEACRQTHTLLATALDGKVPRVILSDQPVMSGRTVIKTFTTNRERIDSLYPSMRDDGGEIVYVEVHAEVHPENRPDICSSRMWRLDVKCRVLE
ncbi:vegetative incompatibility protein HET-E-1 [Naviculisporaceae sp. PSN 640]